MSTSALLSAPSSEAKENTADFTRRANPGIRRASCMDFAVNDDSLYPSEQEQEIILEKRNSLMTLIVLAAACHIGFAQNSTFTIDSAGNWGPIVAPDSIAAGFGSNLTTQTYSALAVPLPMQLGGVSIQLTDSSKATSPVALYMASEGQINFLIPSNAAVGAGSVTVTPNSGTTAKGTVLISQIAPAIFTANQNGMGVAAAQAFYYTASGSSSYVDTFAGGTSSTYGTSPVSLSPSTDQVYLVLYGTGIRHHSLNPVEATIGGTNVPVTYAGAVSSDPGLDQVNIGPLPQSLAGTGKGDVPVIVTVDGAPANTVTVNIE
jgi:uncharacterized protein (TIGR03437 family)